MQPSGEQFVIACGDQQASVVEVGGGLRQYEVGGREVLDGYDETQRCTGARGLPLIPWPNRIEDGAYTFDGEDYQVPLTEPASHNAIHGFLRWRNWTCREHTDDTVVMGSVLRPLMGYPFTLDVAVSYAVGAEGLTVRTTATNVGDQTCPYACGQHPYLGLGHLGLGTDLVDECSLELDAQTWLPTDDRGLPIAKLPVDGSDYDFRTGRPIGEQNIDYAFTDLVRDDQGLAWAHLGAPDGGRASFWADESYSFIEIYTAHTQAAPHWRTGLGVEPMTGAPNAFRSGDGLIRLSPGETATSSWGIRAT